MNNKTLALTLTAFFAAGLLAVGFARSFFSRCPTDEQLIQIFVQNRSRLQELLTMIAADQGRISYVGRGIVTVDGPLPQERRSKYLREVEALGALSLSQTKSEGGEVTIWMWGTGLSISGPSQSKGFGLILPQNLRRYKIRDRLDGIEKGLSNAVYARRIQGDWYLIFYQSNNE